MPGIWERAKAAASTAKPAEQLDQFGRTPEEAMAGKDQLAPFIIENHKNAIRKYPLRHDIPNLRKALELYNDPEVHEMLSDMAEFVAQEKGWPKNLAMCVIANAAADMRMLTYTPIFSLPE